MKQFQYEIQDYQEDCVNNIVGLFEQLHQKASFGDVLNAHHEKYNYNFPVQENKNIDVMMETGTGKTFTFIKTIFELSKHFGYQKFIILIPTVPIREGTKTNLEDTKDYFKSFYANEKQKEIETFVYEGGNISAVKQFINTAHLSVLILTPSSFNSKDNILNRPLEQDINTPDLFTHNQEPPKSYLECLKRLKNYYNGEIKCIYIDPPYNTDKDEFVYPDKFDKEEAEVLGLANLSESDFARMEFSFKSKKSHNGWLAFMYPRLLLAKDLLSNDGVIFISIDDNEQANLKLLCDDIFGEENLQTILSVQVRYADKSLTEEKPFIPLIENILVYSKTKLFVPTRPKEDYTADKFIYEIEEKSKGEEFSVGDQLVKVFKKDEWSLKKHENGETNRLKETWITGSIYSTMSYGKVFQRVVEPRITEDGLGCLYKVIGRGEDGLGYRYYTGPQKANATKGKMYSGMPLERVEELKSEQGAVRYTQIPTFFDYSADFGNIRSEGGVGFNSGKKPIKMIKQLLEWSVLPEQNSTILDFFAGSGSTGHAVMQFNAEVKSNHKFILCQLDEPIKEDKSDYQFCIDNNLPPVISSITIERLKRAGEKIAKEIEEENSKAGMSEEDKKQVPDIGFKVFDSVEAPKLAVDEHGQISINHNLIDPLSRIYNMVFAVGLDEPTQVPEEVVKDCIYKIGQHFYITNSQNVSSEDLANTIKTSASTAGKVFIDGWTASLNGTLQSYKDDVKIVF